MYPGVYVCWGEGEEMWTCSWLRTFVVKTRYHDDLNWKEDHGRREQVASADLGMGWQRETGRTERWSPGLGIWQISDRRCDSWVVRPKTSFPENVMNPVLEMLYLKCPRDSQEDNWWGWVYLGFKGVLQGFWIGEKTFESCGPIGGASQVAPVIKTLPDNAGDIVSDA